jgi:hypothetical protein
MCVTIWHKLVESVGQGGGGGGWPAFVSKLYCKSCFSYNLIAGTDRLTDLSVPLEQPPPDHYHQQKLSNLQAFVNCGYSRIMIDPWPPKSSPTKQNSNTLLSHQSLSFSIDSSTGAQQYFKTRDA